jgi:hypothetical protein
MIRLAYQRVAGRVNTRVARRHTSCDVEPRGFLATRPGSCYRLRMRRRPAARFAHGALPQERREALGYVQ